MNKNILNCIGAVAISMTTLGANAQTHTVPVRGSAIAATEGLARNLAISQISQVCSTRYSGRVVGHVRVSVSLSGRLYRAVASGTCGIG